MFDLSIFVQWMFKLDYVKKKKKGHSLSTLCWQLVSSQAMSFYKSCHDNQYIFL